MLDRKYILIDQHESYCTGKIIGRVNEDHYYLVAFDIHYEKDPTPLRPQEAVAVEEIAGSLCEECGSRRWKIFDTASDRQAWIDWMEKPSPESKKVLDLVSTKRH